MQTLHVPAASLLVEHWYDCEPVVLAIFVNFNGSNFGITTLQHVLAVHSAADTPASPADDTTARPTIADRTCSQHRRRDDARAPCGHKPPPARSTEATPTPPTETIDRTVDQKSRYAGRRTTTTPRPFSVSPAAAPPPCCDKDGGGAGTDAVPTFTVAPALTPPPEQVHVPGPVRFLP